MLTEDQCWTIVQQRNQQYDGVFYVGVHTTRIFCRPSCSARPLRKNVHFYATVQAAMAAGLRPCKRCHPDTISPEVRAINIICRYLESAPDAQDLQTLASLAGYSPFHLTRLFKAHLGVSPKQYSAMLRRQRMRHELGIRRRVAHVALDTGFQSLGAMYADAPLGMPPTTYTHGSAGVTLQCSTIDTPFGILVIVTTARGVCFVAFADTLADVAPLVANEYPSAAISYVASHPLADAVAQLLTSHPNHTDIPIDIRATAFQQRVWHALRHIPSGETRTYAQIANEIAEPRASRAVANACAQNPLAVVIPCHRVVRSDGTIGGYRWNSTRKRAMLTHEQHSRNGES